MLKPGTSALFLIVANVTPDKAVAALSRYGGTVLESSLSSDAEQELQEALNGEGAEARPRRPRRPSREIRRCGPRRPTGSRRVRSPHVRLG
jgi:hypothetical protein